MVVDRPEGDGPPVGPPGIPEPEARTTMHARFASSIALAAACTTTALATDTPCEERVASDCHWSSQYPFNTIGSLTWPIGDDRIGVGTGFLVSPYCGLTNGHCLFNRNAGRYIAAEQTFTPGSCLDGNVMRTEFGRQVVADKQTNSKYANPEFNPAQAVDYGCFWIACPFEEITTFMPLCFGYESTWAHMSGYPINSLPDPSKAWSQWIAFGDVNEHHERWVEYDARSTGGASGSPVWNWRADETLVEVFAINSAHFEGDQCGGLGPRLVWQNEDLIRSWMNWRPSLQDQIEGGCADLVVMPFPGLLEFFELNDDLAIDPRAIRVEDPIASPPTGPSRRYMQIIENGFYEWLEYDLQPGNPESSHLVQMLAAPGMQLPGEAWFPGMPFEPQQQGWLSVEKATALYSGSAGRASAPVLGIGRMEIEVDGRFEPVTQPRPFIGDHAPDLEPDAEAPVDEGEPCPGDLNGDGKVDGADMGLMLGAWGTSDPAADLDGDGDVDGADLGLLLGAWGACA